MKGPFSSRAGAVNKYGEEVEELDWGPVLDVRFKTDLEQLTPRSGAVTLEAAQEAVDQYLEDVELVREVKFRNDEPYYIPRRQGDSR